jgi:hypothetical protein
MPANADGGNVPLGIWRQNPERSAPLEPGERILWIIKDDGKHLIWVVVLTTPQGEVRLNAWDGAYDAAPKPVFGTPMSAQITSPEAGVIRSRGSIEGMGPFSEEARVMDGGKRFVAHGQVTTADGRVLSWTEDYDWIATAPTSSASKTRP